MTNFDFILLWQTQISAFIKWNCRIFTKKRGQVFVCNFLFVFLPFDDGKNKSYVNVLHLFQGFQCQRPADLQIGPLAKSSFLSLSSYRRTHRQKMEIFNWNSSKFIKIYSRFI